jgi:hypothetical protein
MVFCIKNVIAMEGQMRTRAVLLRTSSVLAICWYNWRLPQTLYVRALRVSEHTHLAYAGFSHGVWREYGGLLCLTTSSVSAFDAARAWAERWHTVVHVH